MQHGVSSVVRRRPGLIERRTDRVCFVARPAPGVEVFDLFGATRLVWASCAEPRRVDEILGLASPETSLDDIESALALLVDEGLVEVTGAP